MFNQGVSTTALSTGFNDSLELKYTVADILTSMTSSAPITPTTLTSGAFSTGITTGSTQTSTDLTPTTLNNIEQTFIDLQNSPAVSRAPDLSRESGFVPPVINPLNVTPVMVQIKSEVDYDDSSMGSSDQDFGGVPSSKRRRNEDGSFSVPQIDPNTYLVANSRRPTGPRKERRNEMLSPEEEARRRQRRDRNKQAAAKCRQKRENHTSRLINETEGLEEEKAQLENEIQTLNQQREQLEFILQAHKANCQAVKRQLKAPVSSMPVVRSNPYPTVASSVAAQRSNPYVVKSSPVVSSASNFCSTRPNSLPIQSTMANRNLNSCMPSVAEAIGVAINTPSSGVGVFNFDAMIEGHTGLTPYTGVAPSTLGVSTSTLTTMSTSCAGQMKRRSTDSSSSSNELSSPTLITS